MMIADHPRHVAHLLHGGPGARLIVRSDGPAGDQGGDHLGEGVGPGLVSRLARHAQAQGVQLDEAAGVAVVVGDLAFLEGDQVLVVQAVGAFAADDRDIALVELDRDLAGDLGWL
jgi:hypothetical protein